MVKASRLRDVEEQCLYLVLDTKSDDVLLHNGKQRLGMVAPSSVKAVRAALKSLAAEDNVDQVIVCKLNFIDHGLSEHTFIHGSSFNITPVYGIYERLARKYSNKYRKD